MRLARLDLRGNRIANVTDIGGLPKSLLHLFLQSPSCEHPNAACAASDYAISVHRAAPWLEELDGRPFVVPSTGVPDLRIGTKDVGGDVALPHFEKARERFGRRLSAIEREMRFEELENKVALLQNAVKHREDDASNKNPESDRRDENKAPEVSENPWKVARGSASGGKATFVHTRIVREQHKKRTSNKHEAAIKTVASLQSQVKRLQNELARERERANGADSPVVDTSTQCAPPSMRSAPVQTETFKPKPSFQVQTQTQPSQEEIDLKVQVAVLQSRLAASLKDLERVKREKRDVEESRQREIDSEMEVALEFTASRTKAAVVMNILRDAERAARDALDECRTKYKRADAQLRELRNAYEQFDRTVETHREAEATAKLEAAELKKKFEEREAAAQATQRQLASRASDLESELAENVMPRHSFGA